MLCGHFIGMEKLERLKLLQNDTLVHEFDVLVKEPETVSRYFGNFTFKKTQNFRDINFKVFSKLFSKSQLTAITIDIDSSVINAEASDLFVKGDEGRETIELLKKPNTL